MIRVNAVDDVQIVRVSIRITDGSGTVLEQGTAEQSDASLWTYTTQVQTGDSRRVEVTVMDLPGHAAQTAWQNS